MVKASTFEACFDCVDAFCTRLNKRVSLADAAAADFLGFFLALTLPNTQGTLFTHRLLLLGCDLLFWVSGSFCLFCGLFLDWFLLGPLLELVEHGLLELFLYRNRLCLFFLLLFLKCLCCCFRCLLLLFNVCVVFYWRENEPAVRVGYGLPNLLRLFLGETVTFFLLVIIVAV